MKIGDFIIGILIGLSISLLFYSCYSDPSSDIACDSLEESRLKIALNECSDAVMSYAWGEIKD